MKITLRNLRQLIRESLQEIEPLSVRALYHGTTSERANKIRVGGFSLSKIGQKLEAPMPGISTSVESDVAEDHANIAAEKFGGEPEVLVIDGSRLRIAPGSLYFSMWDEHGSSEAALEMIKGSGEWDAAALFDMETGDGIEEYEVLIFNPSKIRII